MKRFIALTLVLVLCASLFAGCASKKASLEGTPAEIIEKIYMDTNISLTQIASEMIKYAADHVTIEHQTVVNEVLKK